MPTCITKHALIVKRLLPFDPACFCNNAAVITYSSCLSAAWQSVMCLGCQQNLGLDVPVDIKS